MQETADEASEHSPAIPHVIKSVSEFDDYISSVSSTTPVLIQFTASWCRRCTTLKHEIAKTFDSSLHWLAVDVDENTSLQEWFHVNQLPRFDVYCSGRTTSIEAFDAKVDAVAEMLQVATAARPNLEFLDDF
jgi:thioredoxin-like negative regulator of GroEL